MPFDRVRAGLPDGNRPPQSNGMSVPHLCATAQKGEKDMSDNQEIAKDIYNALNEKGAELGSSSLLLISNVLSSHNTERGRTLRAPDVSALELLAEMQDNAFFLNNKESVKWRKKITAVLTNAERR